MVSEDKDQCAFPWWWDSQHRSHQSQWLETTLSDLDKKIKIILNMIEDDGDSFAKRAEMFYNNRPELIKMVNDLSKSYRSLAEKYDQLKSESIKTVPRSLSSSLSSFRQVECIQNCDKGTPENTKVLDEPPTSEPESAVEDPDLPTSEPESVFEDPDFDAETAKILDSGSLNIPADESLMPTDSDSDSDTDTDKNMKMKPTINGNFNGRGMKDKVNGAECAGKMGLRDFKMPNSEREKTWNEMRLTVTKMIQDNMQLQAELIRRNDQKGKAIKDLCSQIKLLMDENRALKSSLLASHKLKVVKRENRSEISKMVELFVRKLTG